MNNIYLNGSEEVQRAGSQIQSAANDMQRAASSISEIFERQRCFLDDWLYRFQAVVRGD